MLVDPGAMRTSMRAEAMPGEDSSLLPHPDQISSLILPLCLSSWEESGKIFDCRNKKCSELRDYLY